MPAPMVPRDAQTSAKRSSLLLSLKEAFDNPEGMQEHDANSSDYEGIEVEEIYPLPFKPLPWEIEAQRQADEAALEASKKKGKFSAFAAPVVNFGKASLRKVKSSKNLVAESAKATEGELANILLTSQS